MVELSKTASVVFGANRVDSVIVRGQSMKLFRLTLYNICLRGNTIRLSSTLYNICIFLYTVVIALSLPPKTAKSLVMLLLNSLLFISH